MGEQDVSKADIEMADLESKPAVTAYSLSNLENVDNIDKDDVENPQLVVEYVNEIYAYLRQLETIQDVREDYLNKSTGTSILPKERTVAVSRCSCHVYCIQIRGDVCPRNR